MERSDVAPAGAGLSVLVPLLSAALTALFFASFLVGRYDADPRSVAAILISRVWNIPHTWPEAMETVVLGIRLPRVVGAMLVGGALAASGSAYQSLFKNPLVSPAILGVSAGAGLGAAVALLLSLPWLMVQAMAFGFGLAAVLITTSISRAMGASSLTVLVLAGVVVTAVFEALISLIKYVADPFSKLPAITFWLLGGLARVSAAEVGLASIPIAVGLVALALVRWQINVLAMGDDDALALGVQASRVRVMTILATTLMAAAAVSISGIVGWVGLLIPHLARMLVGPRFEALLPVSFLMGAAYLLAVDDVVRMMSVEVPLGILTSLIGAPFFVYLMVKTERAWD